MSKQTFTYWIYAKLDCGQVEHDLSDIKWSERYCTEKGIILVGEHYVEHEFGNGKEMVPLFVKSLEEKRDGIRAEMSVQITEVDNEIASLLALENQS